MSDIIPQISMPKHSHQPREYDAVLGNQSLPPAGGVVLGGMEGLKLSFSHSTEARKIAILKEALNYGEEGLELVIQALGDAAERVQWNAYSLLRERAEPKIRQILQDYLPSVSPVTSDCARLGGLLAVGNWKEADRETATIMLRASGKDSNSLLKLPDIERLPPQFIRTIDRLWMGCSDGKFGLTVQYQIWQELGGNAHANYKTWYRFCDRLGWGNGETWIPYNDFTFSLDAPQGHLPFLPVGGFGVVVCLQSLFSRLAKW
jgi:hypothetical protein